MRIVYDDTMQETLVRAIGNFMNQFDVNTIVAYDYGMNRVQMDRLKKKLNSFLGYYYSMEIGNKVTHAHGIGNNCNYPVYYHAENEVQHCANININTGMYGEGYVSIEDYNGNRIGKLYEVRKFGITSKW